MLIVIILCSRMVLGLANTNTPLFDSLIVDIPFSEGSGRNGEDFVNNFNVTTNSSWSSTGCVLDSCLYYPTGEQIMVNTTRTQYGSHWDLLSNKQNKTICFWARSNATSLGSPQFNLGFGTDNPATNLLRLTILTSTHLLQYRLIVGGPGVVTGFIDIDQNLNYNVTDNSWHQICMVHATNATAPIAAANEMRNITAQVYINGVSIINASAIGGSQEPDYSTSGSSLAFGFTRDGNNINYSHFIDEFLIWNRTLTYDEISELYAGYTNFTPEYNASAYVANNTWLPSGHTETHYLNLTVTNNYLNRYNLSTNLTANLLLNNTWFTGVLQYVRNDVYVFEAIANITNIPDSTTNNFTASWFYTNFTNNRFDLVNLTNNVTVYIAPYHNFNLRKEQDNTLFDLTDVTHAMLEILCIDGTTETHDFTGDNISQLHYNISCVYESMKVNIIYPGTTGSYYRQLIPEYTDYNITFFLIDLEQETAVERIINLIDVTDNYNNAIIKIRRSVTGTTQDIIESYFDVSNKVSLYLIKNELYALSIIDDDGNEELLGNLITSSAGEQTITVPTIKFEPTNIYLENESIKLSYAPANFTSKEGSISFVYNASIPSTSYVSFTVFLDNGTVVYNQTSASNTATFTYTFTDTNSTYYSRAEFKHSEFTESKVQVKVWSNVIESFSGNQWFSNIFGDSDATMHYASLIFLGVWGLLFGALFALAGLLTTIFWLILFTALGWFNIGAGWLAYTIILSVIGILALALKGGKS